jgi:pyruvate/2-oxoglutarate dehydrogenase complex dihydrolipoamide dehydrogenase (E3) component
MFMKDGANLHYASEIKKHVGTPVATVGAFTDPDLMEKAIADGKADVIELARGLIADPDLPLKARSGDNDRINHCLRCYTCFSNLLSHRQFCCSINPEIGVERDVRYMPPPSSRRTVLIAGGGVSGMTAALTAYERGHRVMLYEKKERLGGVLQCEEKIPFKAALARYLRQQEKRIFDSGIEVQLGTPLTPAIANKIAPDAIIAALGAKPIKPDILGIDRPNVISAENAYTQPDKIGRRVAIIGGGFVGIELGLFLRTVKGAHVSIIEMTPSINHGGNFLHSLALEYEMRKAEVRFSPNTKAREITPQGVDVEKTDGSRESISADTVIYAVGQIPLRAEIDALRFCAPEFYEVGDCCGAPSTIRNATRTGYFIACNIDRRR